MEKTLYRIGSFLFAVLSFSVRVDSDKIRVINPYFGSIFLAFCRLNKEKIDVCGVIGSRQIGVVSLILLQVMVSVDFLFKKNNLGTFTGRCALFKINLKGRFVYLDEQAESIFGFSHDELYGRSLIDNVVDEERSRVEHWLAVKRFQQPEWEHCTLLIKNRQGEEVLLDTIVNLHFSGGVPANYQFIVRSANVKKQFENALNAPERWLKSIEQLIYTPVDSGGDKLGFTAEAQTEKVVDFAPLAETGTFLVTQRLYCAWCGCFLGDSAKSDLKLIAQTGNPPGELTEITSVLSWVRGQKFETPGTLEIQPLGKLDSTSESAVADIDTHWEDYFFAICPIDDNKLLIFVWGKFKENQRTPEEISYLKIFLTVFSQIAGSLSQRKQKLNLERSITVLEEQCNFLQKQISQKQDELQRVIDSLAHDLREPLIAVQGWVQQLHKETRGHLIGPGLEIFRGLQENTKILSKMLDDLLYLSRLGHTALQPEKVDLPEVIAEIRNELHWVKKTDINWTGIDKLPTVIADRKQLTQIFRNLLSNGVKYIQGQTHPHISVVCTEHASDWEMMITDNGIGIPPSQQDKIFEMFTRLPNPINDKQKGTGMGLAVVKYLIEKTGGKIWVESQEGQGATFHFTIPRPVASIDSPQ